MYPKTLSGLVQCYALGLPFFRREVVSDLLFSAIFFGVPALASAWSSRRAQQKATA
jgi:hypothetical protein